MTTRTQSYQKELTSQDEAIVVGYDEGALLRKNGAQPNALQFNIETNQGNYPDSPFYDHWLKGFRAGFLGERKPTH
jgi:hypothetical protein